MARIDPDLAFQWSAEHGHRYDGRVRQAAAEMLAELDGPEALAMLTPADPGESQYTLQRLADRFAPTDPKKALLFVEEAVVRARALHQPGRAAALARAGDGARPARPRRGRTQADRRGRRGRHPPGDRDHGGLYARRRRQGAGPVRRQPRPGAGRIDPMTRTVIPGSSPPRSPRKTRRGPSPWPMRWPATGRTPIRPGRRSPVRIGADRPDEAIRIIEGMKSFAADYMRAEAFAWLAIAVAPRDRPRAFALIDRALASPVDRPRLYESWINSGGGDGLRRPHGRRRAAGRLPGHGQRDHAGDDDAAPTPPGPGPSDPAMQIRSATMAAVPLALVDPGAARVLLQQLEARSGLDPAKLAEVAGPDWLRAWALVDLKKAEALFEAQLAAIEGTKDVKLEKTGFFRMTEILALPPHRRDERGLPDGRRRPAGVLLLMIDPLELLVGNALGDLDHQKI